MTNRKSFFENRISSKQNELNEVVKKCNLFSILRLVIVIITILIAYFMYKKANYSLVGFDIITGFIIFVAIAFIHSKNLNRKNNLEIMINMDKEALDRTTDDWRKFKDNGKEYLNVEHPFCNDLDVFGKSSLFQWINTTTTIFGREKLRDILLIGKLPNKEEIYERQNSLKELGEKLDFRQELQAIGKKNTKKNNNINDFLNWLKGKDESILGLPIKLVSIILPVVVIASIILYFPFGIIKNPSIPIALLIVNNIVVKLLLKGREETINIMYSLKANIKTYFSMIQKIEKEDFNSNELNLIKKKLFNSKGNSATEGLKELNSLENKIADRNNMIHIVINSLFLWDVYLVIALEIWRRNYGEKVEGWLEVLGEFEALSSLSNLNEEKKDWCYPVITDNLELKARNLGHPLLSEKNMICNSFEVNSNKNIVLITGSNMSGKSTFLRTVGINMFLTYLGAPACGENFKCPILNLYTCMRIGDNLEESISSFYAEILRVKKLIEATKRGEKVFFLLDEIFRGTNSIDRHMGAQILINQLCEKEAMGFVSTHDLELCDLEEENPKVVNYNFKEYYKNNEIKFDYKLRRGKSTTRNAVYLMRMAGIEI